MENPLSDGGLGTLTLSNSLTLGTDSPSQVDVEAATGTSDLVKDFTTASYPGTLAVPQAATQGDRGLPQLKVLLCNSGMRLLLLCISLLSGVCPLHSADTNTPHHLQFEPAIRAFEVQDRTNPPPRDAVLFTGSSSIRLWTNASAAFPEHRILNRGFGGSHLSDLNAFFDRVVLPYGSRLIVLYEGDNDIASGKSPDQVRADFDAFARRVRTELPATRVAFIAIKPSPSRLKHLERMQEANRLIREALAQHSGWVYVDVFTPMLNEAGEPRPELFRSDRLHLNDEGYQLWADLLKPVLDRMAPRP